MIAGSTSASNWPLADLEGVLDAEQRSAGDARLLGALGRELGEDAAQLRLQEDAARQRHVAPELELRHRVEAMGRSGMAGGEGQIAGLRVRLGVAQIVGAGVERLAVEVDAQIGDVEVVARELEVVGIAAEEGDRLLGREHQPHVLVAAVLVEIVDAAVIELDHVAADVVVVAGAFAARSSPSRPSGPRRRPPHPCRRSPCGCARSRRVMSTS